MASCYYANGKEVGYVPCNHTAVALGQHSSCCAEGDGCLANGLCKTKYNGDWAQGNYYWRQACTDRTWSDPACANFCRFNYREDQLIWKCREPGTWCCNDGDPPRAADRAYKTNYTCCSMEELTFGAEDGDFWTTASPLPVSLSSAIPSTGTPTPSASGSPAETDTPAETGTPAESTISQPDSGSTNNSLAIGLGVGLGVALLVLAGIIGFIIRRRRSKRNIDPAPEYKPPERYAHNAGQPYGPGEHAYGYENERHLNSGVPIEIGTNNETQELDSDRRSLPK
ncbi:hypothetical protein BS50DRAFT_672308 [Corynespora cassiicola Philippines]|uniref:Mid2 domain-containing protein n=1 Tax=Corynespora cassiicola Philippines TaxID=1448308 RepID=A0A2T2P756_CORCC|nr:hypothetical protein BS50DRAFT_672308 [Corynespora cassiicola Philippines]